MGAQLVREVASKTNDVAGDGTTTATVLAQAIVHEGLQQRRRRRATRWSSSAASTRPSRRPSRRSRSSPPRSTTRSEIAQVASISGNDTEIGELIADAMEKVGKDGVITVEESKGTATTLEVVEGMQFDKGYISPYMVTDPERMEAVLEDPLHPHLREEDLRRRGPDPAAGEGRCRPRKPLRDHRRGRRRRGAGDPGRQQAARHAATSSR